MLLLLIIISSTTCWPHGFAVKIQNLSRGKFLGINSADHKIYKLYMDGLSCTDHRRHSAIGIRPHLVVPGPTCAVPFSFCVSYSFLPSSPPPPQGLCYMTKARTIQSSQIYIPRHVLERRCHNQHQPMLVPCESFTLLCIYDVCGAVLAVCVVIVISSKFKLWKTCTTLRNLRGIEPSSGQAQYTNLI